MKKIIIVLSLLICSIAINAQIKDKDLKIKVGGRVSFDAAHYINDKIDMSSGVQIGEARLNIFASLNEKYDVKLDLDFSNSKINYKDIFARWNINEKSCLRIGHYVMPFSMHRSTSTTDIFFIAAPSTVNSLTISRRIGVSYKIYNKTLWGEAGLFGGKINKDKGGDNGWGTSLRAVFNPEISNDIIFHVGAGMQYRTPDPNGFTDGDDDYNRFIRYKSNAETTVDNTNLVNAFVENAKRELGYNAELLLVGKKFFIQGEFTGRTIWRKRNNQKLFEQQLGEVNSFPTLEAWEAANGKSLRSVSFKGLYLQAGYIIIGGNYKYKRFHAFNTPAKEKGTLEILGRFNYTNLNDEKGRVEEPLENSNLNYNIRGGKLNSYTVGLNYYFNKYARFMVNYGYLKTNNSILEDKYVQVLQARLQISL